MVWSKERMKSHIEAARLLSKIKDEVLDFIKTRRNVSEIEVQNFVLKEFAERKLKNEIAKPIVAFGENTSFIHYYPKTSTNKKLGKASLILLDIWARQNKKGASYADMTWMAWRGGKVPEPVQNVFETVIKARDKSLNFIRRNTNRFELLKGKNIDFEARNYIDTTQFKGRFLHSTGHELGLFSPHGRGRKISPRSSLSIKKYTAYTIEPGIYLEDKFGVRSEIDFYINKKNQVVVTTDIQRKLTLL